MDKKQPEVTPQAMEVYKLRHAQVDFIKKQQWVVTNYAVAIYVAIVWVSHNLRIALVYNLILIVTTVAVAGGATLLLWQFQVDLKHARLRVDEINDLCFSHEQRKKLYIRDFEKQDPQGPFWRGWNVLLALMAVCIVGGFITAGILISGHDVLCGVACAALMLVLMPVAFWIGDRLRQRAEEKAKAALSLTELT
jgi:fatty acid desaturase